MDNIEFTGLDFKSFFVLTSAVDYVYIYGKEKNGYINESVLNFYYLILGILRNA